MVAETTTVMRLTPDEINKLYNAFKTLTEFVDFYLENVDNSLCGCSLDATLNDIDDLLSERREDTIIR